MSTQSRAQAGRKPRILVVEDDDSMRRSMQLFLRGRGFDVLTYASAGQLLREENVEAACLVADYRLGVQDGISLLGALRARGWMGPAILTTGFPSEELRSSARTAGFDLFLEKPFQDHALINGINRLINASYHDVF
ncbi:response regulator [Sphingomonas lycopersici]|uniref:response regulator n=1 Tax=Sphingomonas lycopersici TaxID=2951807 RepID=UPI00223739CC|nr:response regulator [Sphingomonas lycopersici]